MSSDELTAMAAAMEIAHTGRLVPQTVTDWTRRAGAFQKWHQENVGDRAPDENALLAYLLDRDDRSWGTLRADVQAISWYYSTAESGSPVSPLIRAYLHDKCRREGRARLPKTLPLRVAEVAKIADALQRQPSGFPFDLFVLEALRSLIVLARRAAGPREPIDQLLISLTRRDAIAIQVNSGRPVLTVHGRPVGTEGLSPHQFEQWNDYVRWLAKRPGMARNRLRSALKRTGIPSGTWAEDLSDVQWDWLWENADPDTPRRVRDLAYLLVGLSGARRHIELERACIEDVYPEGEGYLILYRETKGGHDYTAVVNHAASAGGQCTPACPACALAILLEYEKVCRGRTAGPLVATYYGQQYRQMTRQNGRYRIRAMTKLAFGAAWGSTRSLRSGAATSALEQGWTVEEITELTGHRDVNQVRPYTHYAKRPEGTLQMGLGDC